MEKIFITSINDYLTKRNIYSTRMELLKQFENRKQLSLYQLQDLLQDFKGYNRYIAATMDNHSPINIYCKIIVENKNLMSTIKRIITNKIKTITNGKKN